MLSDTPALNAAPGEGRLSVKLGSPSAGRRSPARPTAASLLEPTIQALHTDAIVPTICFGRSANLRRWSCLTVSMIRFRTRKSPRGEIHPLNLPLSHPVTRRTNVTVTKCCPIGFALGKCGSVASTYLRDGGACVTTRFRALRSASRRVLVNRWRPRRSRSASAESSQ